MIVKSSYNNREFDIDNFCGVGEGWKPLINNLCRDLYKIGWDGSVSQIKEKFGGLRFYANNVPEGGRSLIDRAEADSYKICEECGSDGEPINKGWVRTLCNRCREAEEEHYE